MTNFEVEVGLLARSTRFSISEVWDACKFWEDIELGKKVTEIANTIGCSIYEGINILDNSFSSIDRENYRAIARLQILVIQMSIIKL